MPPPGPRPHVLGLDMGGTHLRAVLVGADGRPGPVLRTPVPADPVERAVLPARVAAGTAAAAVGLAVAGLVEGGVLVESVNLGLHEVDFRPGFGVPAVVVNDAVAAGVAEAGPTGLVLFVGIGTGIGGALIRDGSPVGGAARAAGEVGHMVLDPAGPSCGCGRRGCWERLCGGDALRAAAEAAGCGMDALVETDQPAWRRAVEMFTLGLDNLCLALAPDQVVLGGGVMARRGPVARGYLAATRSLRWGAGIEFRPARLGDDSGALGAARLAARLRPST